MDEAEDTAERFGLNLEKRITELSIESSEKPFLYINYPITKATEAGYLDALTLKTAH